MKNTVKIDNEDHSLPTNFEQGRSPGKDSRDKKIELDQRFKSPQAPFISVRKKTSEKNKSPVTVVDCKQNQRTRSYSVAGYGSHFAGQKPSTAQVPIIPSLRREKTF